MSEPAGFRHVINLFGTASDMARKTGYQRSQISMLTKGKRELNDPTILKILRAAQEHGMDVKEVAHMLQPSRCDCCGNYVNRDIREMLA